MDCSVVNKPIPARRCSLQPCSVWRAGPWSKCSRNCERGSKTRDVTCMDSQTARPLRPFHCQALLYRPPGNMSCNSQPCLSWSVQPWRKCSKSCGWGRQHRAVTCSKPNLCDMERKPKRMRVCSIQPCAVWLPGPWGNCTAACGGGVQQRPMLCVSVATKKARKRLELCKNLHRPMSIRRCNIHHCAEKGCSKDHLQTEFCRTLHRLGRCHLPSIRTRCCRSCQQPQGKIRPTEDPEKVRQP
uniref:A disintegrin and metalloproteinase with thrombospondin motifs 7-like n=1 Tax=Myxine glutinosa TaxID=7769 RepID=UPI00358E034C